MEILESADLVTTLALSHVPMFRSTDSRSLYPGTLYVRKEKSAKPSGGRRGFIVWVHDPLQVNDYDFSIPSAELYSLRRMRMKTLLTTTGGISMPPILMDREQCIALQCELQKSFSVYFLTSERDPDLIYVRPTVAVSPLESESLDGAPPNGATDLLLVPPRRADSTELDDYVHDLMRQTKTLTRKVFSWTPLGQLWKRVAVGAPPSSALHGRQHPSSHSSATSPGGSSSNSDTHEGDLSASYMLVSERDTLDEEMRQKWMDDEFQKLLGAYRRQRMMKNHEKPVSLQEFKSLQQKGDGSFTPSQWEKCCQNIYERGLAVDARKEAWPFLLGLYSPQSTAKERAAQLVKLTEDYANIRLQWSNITPEEELDNAEYRDAKHRVEKDVIRTDRHLLYFSADNGRGLDILRSVLLSYCMFDWDVKFCQGMSDLLAPFVMILDDEVLAFHCFVQLMKTHGAVKNFFHDQSGIAQQLGQLLEIVKKAHPAFFKYMEDHDLLNLFFCFRWILVHFKREFEMDDICRVWETFWSNPFVQDQMHIYAAGALLIRHSPMVMREQMEFDDILRYMNDLSGKLEVDSFLLDAEALCLYYESTKERG